MQRSADVANYCIWARYLTHICQESSPKRLADNLYMILPSCLIVPVKSKGRVVTPFKELNKKGKTPVITKQEFDKMLEEKAAREHTSAESEG